ncbi:hypothetical protein [Sphingomonas sp.]|uniref:hypothetical protein n=1 Tax=Sphingomonas sp. TaxID=28214 RepID=UPI0031E12738
MSDAPAPPGLAARLLERADGGVSTLRPRIAQTFAAEQARAAPLIERTGEVVAPPPPASLRPDAPVGSPSAAVTQTVPSPTQRLMPPHVPAAPKLAAQTGPTAIEPQPATAAAPLAPADATAPPAPGAVPGPVPVSSGSTRRAQYRPRQTDSLSAAVMQLLAPDPAAPSATREAPPPPRTDTPLRNDCPSPPTVSAPAPEPPRRASEPGLTIHIGEIVVAPEPHPAPRQAAPRPAWQPPLSLADYRATRARERR